ncbi:MAG TPA: O-methyltransferase [Solirubrobacteraceae bacterium]|jgi:predicted O-methyltransferase YrrM|nr:O-methyltransferase [Solirubrobacteraceae bacterium]
MDQKRFTEVDEYLTDTLHLEDEPLRHAAQRAQEDGLPPIAVTPAQGKLLQLIAQIHGARRILELGVLGGYSTIFLARALPPDGRLISLELQESYAQTARASIAAAGLSDRVEVRVGPALEGMQALQAEGAEPFDLTFIDADKPATPEYFEHALALSRPGALIISDNVVRHGELADPDTADAGAQGMRRFHELLAAEPRVSATTIQTVGAKGYDGFTLALVTG